MIGFENRTQRETPHCKRSAPWVFRFARFGSVLFAARAIELSAPTLYRAVAGLNVSTNSRQKIESAFGKKLEELQKPYDLVSGSDTTGTE
jgi:hypothetical protein